MAAVLEATERVLGAMEHVRPPAGNVPQPAGNGVETAGCVGGTTGNGGAINIDGGAGGSTSGNGGSVNITGGAAGGSSGIESGGDVIITGGASDGASNGGNIILNTGAAAGPGESGSILMRSAGTQISKTKGGGVQTTDATTTNVVTDGVASGSTVMFRVMVVAGEDATGDSRADHIVGAARNQGGTTAIVGTNVTDSTSDAGASGWTVAVVANDTTDEIEVQVTGEAAHTIDWRAKLEVIST